MAQGLLSWAAYMAGLFVLCSIAYCLLCIVSAWLFVRSAARKRSAQRFLPPVSILKPLRGADSQMYESFRTHCLQDYPEYEIVFGVSDPADPAIAEVERLMKEFPDRRIRLVVCPAILGTNLKVSNLVQMLEHASHHYLLVNDSDIRVSPDHLRRIFSEFADPQVGIVTTLYRGAPGRTLGSKLESLGISTEFSAGVLSARVLESGVHFGLGSTLAFSRAALERIGGFTPLLDYLADDYELGRRISAAGYKVVLSDVIVDTFLPDYRFRDFFEHQLRWGRGVRDSRPFGYLGLAVTFGVPWAVLAVGLSGAAPWAVGLFMVALVSRFVMAYAVAGNVLQDGCALRNLVLLPLRDVIALFVWIATYLSHTVVWRGDSFVLKDGKLARIGS